MCTCKISLLIHKYQNKLYKTKIRKSSIMNEAKDVKNKSKRHLQNLNQIHTSLCFKVRFTMTDP